MIEKPPHIKLRSAIDLLTLDKTVRAEVSRFSDQYMYWSDLKYKKVSGVTDPRELWTLVKSLRAAKSIEIYAPYHIHFSLTNGMMRLCHEFDMKFGGSWGSESLIPQDNRQRYLVGSIIEEAISSSQMEGASTTRKVAKEMLQKHITPKDKSQRMIYNNYQTISYLSAHLDQSLSIDLILQIHSLMTADTLDHPNDSGRFRTNDDVVVENAVTHEIVHTPPCYEEIPVVLQWLVDFVNDNDKGIFIHPIIKAIILHFFISYLHPFVDGNGRTARALFYWYMLKSGYWLTEYLSISRVIYKSKVSYEKSFLQTEADDNDIGYFIHYHLRALEHAFQNLKDYISRKVAQQNDCNRILHMGNLSQRQVEILYLMLKDEHTVLTVKDVSSRFLVTATTAKRDIVGLIEQGLLSEIALNKQKKGYIRGPKYHERIEGLAKREAD